MSTAQRFTSNRKQRVRPCGSRMSTWGRGLPGRIPGGVLKRYHADRIYLVGDIIDGWSCAAAFTGRRRTPTIRRLLTLSKRGTEVIYVTGNHDEFLRRYSSLISATSAWSTRRCTVPPTAASCW